MESNMDQTTESKTSIKAVLFDLDDTLVLTHTADKAAHQAVMELLSRREHPFLDQQAIIDAFVKGFINQPWDPNHQIDVTEWRAQIWCRALEAQAIRDIELAREIQHCFDTTRMASFQWAPEVEQIVQRIKLKGIKVGIITNGHPKVQRAKLSACRADEIFNTILVGGEEVHQKPHKSIFLKACELVGTRPEESVMVGDSLKTDIQGGINAGYLSTVWINNHGIDYSPHELVKPTYIIRNFSELPQVLSLY
ncbi:hypothetical protein SUGI_0780880 [Cryptomeria japonica]|uniref:uncharacterized protein LOC131057169 n=1 Tax=Cryptomeria japonica TaxID=3369 RepID=UPI002414C501|nr:uncharacterized protein LOC131057169 [Cryptomeria japonica]GLJ38338.1 hypothetical protein SUGI_0780880 [Cryptomeria japonica]